MTKRSKRLQPLIEAFENNRVEDFIEELSPQEIGNLLNLIDLRKSELISHYHLIRERAYREITTNQHVLNSALATIADIELAQFEQLADIKQLLVAKKLKNKEEKQERILMYEEESQQQPLKLVAGA